MMLNTNKKLKMKTNKKLMLSLLAMLGMATCASAVELSSPGGVCRLTVDTDAAGRPFYSLTCAGKTAVRQSALGFVFSGRGTGDFSQGFRIDGVARAAKDETWQTVWGEESEIRDCHNELLVRFVNDRESRAMNVRFRLFDDGLGFRYEFPLYGRQAQASYLRVIWTIVDEVTEFALEGNPMAWWIPCDYESQEYDYNVSRVREIEKIQTANKLTGSDWGARGPASAVQTALMLKLENGLYVNLHEAACADFATLNLDWRNDRGAFKALLTPSPDGTRGRLTPPAVSPWRTVIVAEKAVDILASRITLNLNEPCALADTSWIRPVKYVGVWWTMMAGGNSWAPVAGHPEKHAARTDNVKRYLDFAARYGFDALLIEGWNIPYGARSADGQCNVRDFATTYDDVDMDEISRYARAKGVALCLHSETAAGVTDFERAIDRHYDYVYAHNATSVKLGYVSRINPDGTYHYCQWMNNHYLHTVKKAADHRLCVNQHEAVRPTGLCRTYPNLVANEAARGQEFDSFGHVSVAHTTILPFTRLIGGPMDYTPGIVEPNLRLANPRHEKTFISSTVARQLALYLTIPSPLQMAADLPENYEANPIPFEFIRVVPVDWSKSVYLSAEPGEHVLVARRDRHSRDWYVGCTNGETPFEAKFALDFLEPGVRYAAKTWQDGRDAAWNHNPKSLRVSERDVMRGDVMSIRCASGGGFAIRISPR